MMRCSKPTEASIFSSHHIRIANVIKS
ncbi:hypothetical protein OESDEN_02294 [Oesophagostomum dentatum]|uniref:Uncharacterized protein n=1 Tax=Oesophagostomum dentatum TaxID=61180 RepID=A0A0B1TKG5_OESDE|nr:hypothetical protein OESDEN_02294 [Oesophagostomum dentatum]